MFADADPRVPAITLRQLLRMRAGFELNNDATGTATFYGSDDWVAAILARPLTSEPGSVQTYDDGATHLLSAVLTRAVQRPASEFARTHLFRPHRHRRRELALGQRSAGKHLGSRSLPEP